MAAEHPDPSDIFGDIFKDWDLWHVPKQEVHGKQLRENIYFKKVASDREYVGRTSRNEGVFKKRDVSKYTIVQPDGKRILAWKVVEGIDGEFRMSDITSLNERFTVQEEEDTEEGGTKSRQMATGVHAEAIYTMIQETPEATQQEISIFVNRVSRAQQLGLGLALDAAKEFGSRHGKSDAEAEALVPNLTRGIDR